MFGTSTWNSKWLAETASAAGQGKEGESELTPFTSVSMATLQHLFKVGGLHVVGCHHGPSAETDSMVIRAKTV